MSTDGSFKHLVVETFTQAEVKDDNFLPSTHPDRRFNSNNHWDLNEHGEPTPPEDYQHGCNKTNTGHWIDAFRRSYTVLNIDRRDCRWIREAAAVGQVTGECTRLYADEFESAVKKYDNPAIFDGETQYFIRSETVSLKSGKHREGPYRDFRSVLESIITAKGDHSPANIPDGAHIKLYLLPWVSMESYKEFRVFAHDGALTAISQQRLHTANRVLHPLSPDQRKATVERWARLICEAYNSTIKPAISHLRSYVMDLVILGGPRITNGNAETDGDDGSQVAHENADNHVEEPEQVMFIEINPFGKKYSSGSSLFHWLKDEDKLYNNKDRVPGTVYFRYTVDGDETETKIEKIEEETRESLSHANHETHQPTEP